MPGVNSSRHLGSFDLIPANSLHPERTGNRRLLGGPFPAATAGERRREGGGGSGLQVRAAGGESGCARPSGGWGQSEPGPRAAGAGAGRGRPGLTGAGAGPGPVTLGARPASCRSAAQASAAPPPLGSGKAGTPRAQVGLPGPRLGGLRLPLAGAAARLPALRARRRRGRPALGYSWAEKKGGRAQRCL